MPEVRYYCDAHGPSENFGVDSFFRLGGDQYVACESKFTRNESEFSDWMKMSKRKKEEWIWQNKLKKYKGVIPMSWEWVEDRALRAVEDPPVELIDRTEAQNRAVIVEVREMAKAVRKPKNVTRKVNFYGAEDVPIYPGRYRFMCAERTKLSKNLLHLKWTLKVEGSEFIDLDERFDEWVEGRT